MMSSGAATSGSSGAMLIGTGVSNGGRGGSLGLTLGSGNSGAGGNVGVLAGALDAETCGSVTLYSGKGTMSSSGSFVIRTLDAGSKGLSGTLIFSSGTATSGSSDPSWHAASDGGQRQQRQGRRRDERGNGRFR